MLNNFFISVHQRLLAVKKTNLILKINGMRMNCWLQITSARGPEECCRAVYQIMQILLKEAKETNIQVDIIEAIPSLHSKTYKSVMLSVAGDNMKNFINSWEGTVLWIGKSIFRPQYKRKNWFIGVNVLYPPPAETLNNKDFEFESMKASGPGGQHVNKTFSAIRAIHIPSGLSATAQEERSQHMNKKLALAKLLNQIEQHTQKKEMKFQQKQWNMHNTLERGNPIRTYKA
jgi:peptide chain release factor